MRNLFYKRNLIVFTLFMQIILFASDSFAIHHLMKDNNLLVISYDGSVKENWEFVSDFELSKLKSQDTTDPKKKKNDEVMLLLRSYSDSIVIRFAPNDYLSLIHISEPTRPYQISYAVFCLKKTHTQTCVTIYTTTKPTQTQS